MTDARAVVGSVLDPELPVLTLDDLGVVRAVEVDGDAVTVTITPTYSGCPALDEMRADIRAALAAHGWTDVTVRTVLSPAWTTEWLSDDGRRALHAHGIAPPAAGPVLVPLGRRPAPACPRCGSGDTQELARFASTACQALHRCRSCREPFGHFKEH